MSLEQFFDNEDKVDPYSDRVCRETRNRIKVAAAAYAYEYTDKPLMTDGDFDTLAKSIDLTVDTRRPDLDKWFRKNFKPDTGMWVRKHPDHEKLAYIVKIMMKE